MNRLFGLSLLSMVLVCYTATAQHRGYISPKQRVITNTGLSHTNVNDRYGNSFWRQIKCRESNLKYDCIFVNVLIDLQTRGVRFGNQNEALNVQRNITFKNSIVRKLPVTLLDSFGQVEVLDLSNLQIEEIEPFALTNGINIRELNLSFNIIRELPIFAFRNMRFLSVLVLDKNNLTSLPDGMLYGTPNIFDLSIANNNLERIDDNTFKKSKALQFLTISCNKLTHVDLYLVPSLYHVNVSFNLLTMLSVPVAVETLDASHNRINTVTGPFNEELAILLLHHNNLTDTAWIVQYPGLVEVDLSYNEVETITDTHFSDMQRLKQLILSNNRLSEIDLRSSFIQSLLALDVSHNRLLYVEKNQKQFDTLEQLYLDHNSIVVELERIEDNTFKSVTSLESLILSSNELTSIDLAIFPSLFYGNVSFNLLTKLTIPVAVETLDASHNRINTVTGQRYNNLTNLYLDHNNLTDTAWLLQFFQLKVLDLSYNELEEITAIHFKHMKYLEELYLSNNRLVIYTQGSSPILSLKILDVRHNHLLYVEKNEKQFDTLEQLYLDNNLIVTLKLSSTNKLQNLTLSKNDWDCKNLGELLPNVNKSVIGDSDRSCKQEYQLVNDLCCKVSDIPYRDRLIKQISLESLAEKLQRASGRCSVKNTITRDLILDYFVITQNKRLQTTPQRDAEINQLQVDIQKLTQRTNQFKHAVTNLDVEVENNLRRYRVIKEPMVQSKENLRKVYAYLNNRREFKKQETKARESDALLKKEEREAAERENKNLENEETMLKSNLRLIKLIIKNQETVVKLLEIMVNRYN
uniref:Uncharacterized protein n=1 Tax=Anopheles minimus TaxID=112268 RepID=A0A1Y9IW79_9DIPT